MYHDQQPASEIGRFILNHLNHNAATLNCIQCSRSVTDFNFVCCSTRGNVHRYQRCIRSFDARRRSSCSVQRCRAGYVACLSRECRMFSWFRSCDEITQLGRSEPLTFTRHAVLIEFTNVTRQQIRCNNINNCIFVYFCIYSHEILLQ